MGLFVLKASDSVLDRLKAALANLKLDERLSGNNKNYLVSDFAIPYLESVIKELEGDAPKKRPLSNCVPDDFKLPSTFCETGEEIDPRYLDDIKQGKHLTAFGATTQDVDFAKKLVKQSSTQLLKICVDCGKYHTHDTKGYIVSLCKTCEDNRTGLEMDE